MSLALVLALFFQGQPAAAEAPATPAAAAAEVPPPTAPEASWPAGAPRDDYQLVAWCYGALRGYVDLHDTVMPEVTRIETAFRPPGRKLEDDLKVYDELQQQARVDLKRFQAAMTAAERASLQPINTLGASAVAKGHAVWNGGPQVTKARLAQEWMSWTLPARCPATADQLAARARLMGPAFKVNAEDDAPPAQKLADPAPADAPK
ncbi:hypothetical protein [Phenylobacterium sp.]|uniref:hypothetical protein n=1 Tax=Phenylobacterium sp. TaxID=1871053 RepID=UPI002DE58846|nr:hypothetical protein [Phenylobacterium sp.]